MCVQERGRVLVRLWVQLTKRRLNDARLRERKRRDDGRTLPSHDRH